MLQDEAAPCRDLPAPPEPRDRLGGRAPARGRQAGRARRAPGRRPRERDARRCTRREDRRRRPGAARDRAPPRPRHVGADGRSRARRRRTRGSRSSCASARSSARTLALVHGRPRSRSGRIEAPIGRDRGDADACLARHGLAARGDHALRGRARSRPRTRCCACGSRRGGCTRSASIWRRSTCRSSATRSTATPEPGLGAAVPARGRARVPASVHRRADRDALARSRPTSRRSCDLPEPEHRHARYHAGVRWSFEPVGNPRWTVAGADAGFHRGPAGAVQSKPRKGLSCPSSP